MTISFTIICRTNQGLTVYTYPCFEIQFKKQFPSLVTLVSLDYLVLLSILVILVSLVISNILAMVTFYSHDGLHMLVNLLCLVVMSRNPIADALVWLSYFSPAVMLGWAPCEIFGHQQNLIMTQLPMFWASAKCGNSADVNLFKCYCLRLPEIA